MPVVNFAGKHYVLEDGENLLAGLLRQQVKVPFSCRAGVCQSCLLKLDQGPLPKNSQLSLSAEQRSKQHFLACQSCIDADLQVSLPTRHEVPARIVSLDILSPTDMQLTLSTRFPLSAKEGDFVLIVVNPDIQSEQRITVISQEQTWIQCVVHRKVGDHFSRWLQDSSPTGEPVILMISP